MSTPARHIAMVLTRGDVIGGAQTHVIALSEALVARGHRVTVFLGGSDIASFAERLAGSGVRLVSLPGLRREIAPLHDLGAVRRLARVLRAEAPDLVACHSSKAGVVGRLAARLAGIPAVFTAHGWAFAEGVPPLRRRVYRLVERRMARVSAAIITVSRADAELAERCGIAARAPLVTIHNGLADGPPAPWPRGGEAPRLLMVARLAEQKDHAGLLRALSRLVDLPWHLDLVGDGPLETELRGLARRLDLGERVTFHGYRSDVEACIARASLVVLASHWEGLPVSLIEAMRRGRPILASDVGGVRELFGERPLGALIPPDDTAQLADGLRRLLAEPERLRDLGANARARFREAFALETMVARTLEVYEAALR